MASIKYIAFTIAGDVLQLLRLLMNRRLKILETKSMAGHFHQKHTHRMANLIQEPPSN